MRDCHGKPDTTRMHRRQFQSTQFKYRFLDQKGVKRRPRSIKNSSSNIAAMCIAYPAKRAANEQSALIDPILV